MHIFQAMAAILEIQVLTCNTQDGCILGNNAKPAHRKI